MQTSPKTKALTINCKSSEDRMILKQRLKKMAVEKNITMYDLLMSLTSEKKKEI